MTLDDVLEKLEQFYPERMGEDEQQDFCEWWRGLSEEMQNQARMGRPMDAMVADIATYDRRTAYQLTIHANECYLHYRRQCSELRARIAGLENVNRLLNRELDRRFEQ